jgi:hypothetical protein
MSRASRRDAGAVLSFFDRLASAVERSPSTYGLTPVARAVVARYLDTCADSLEVRAYGSDSLAQRQASLMTAAVGGQWWPLKGLDFPAVRPNIQVPGAAARRMNLASTNRTAGHHFDGKNYYVDTAFINAVQHVYPGATLRHMGFGEFTLDTPDGSLEFDRMRGKPFEGQSGQSHQIYDDANGKVVRKAIQLMERSGKSIAASSRQAALRPGSMFVIVDISVPGGKWWDEPKIYDGVREPDRLVAKMNARAGFENYQVIDALWWNPARNKLKAMGMVASTRSAKGKPKNWDSMSEEEQRKWMKWEGEMDSPEDRETGGKSPGKKDAAFHEALDSVFAAKKAEYKYRFARHKEDQPASDQAITENMSPEGKKKWLENKGDMKGDKATKKGAFDQALDSVFSPTAGNRYNYDQWLDFITDGRPTREVQQVGQKFSDEVEKAYDRWFERWAPRNAPDLVDEVVDYDQLAYLTYSSLTGAGVGLWEGDLLGDKHDKAFESVVKRDSRINGLAEQLDYAVFEANEGVTASRRASRPFDAALDSVFGGPSRTAFKMSDPAEFVDAVSAAALEFHRNPAALQHSVGPHTAQVPEDEIRKYLFDMRNPKTRQDKWGNLKVTWNFGRGKKISGIVRWDRGTTWFEDEYGRLQEPVPQNVAIMLMKTLLKSKGGGSTVRRRRRSAA